MTRGRAAVFLGVVAGLSAAGFGAFRLLGPSALANPSEPVVPTARVVRGDLPLTVRLQGDLRATKQISLTAPAVGGMLRVLTVVDTGTAAVKDDEIMTFDPADQQYAKEQAESEVLEAEQEIIKRRAEIKAQEAQDKVSLLTAQFDVRRAALDAAVDADLIGANQHKIRLAELEEAKRNLERLEQDVKARALTSKASLSVLDERKKRSSMNAARATQNMENLVLKAPMDGVVAIRDNMDAGGGMMWEGMTFPSYRSGDNVFSGRPVVDVFDPSTMEVRTRVNEQERTNVAVGQTARVESDAVPGLALTARVSAVAGMGRADFRMGPLRQFDVTLELKDVDPRLKPGTSVNLIVQGEIVKDVKLVPRQALFEIDGKPTVYVRSSAGSDAFTPRQVKVLHRTENQIAVDGIDEGLDVALIDPTTAIKLSGTSSAGSTPLGGKK
jgi:multidrug resistance efflux pump